jgi:hypothetical protein
MTRSRALEDVIAQTDRLQLFDLVDVRSVLAAHPTRPGAPKLRALLDRLAGGSAADLRSRLEVAFMVDFRWPGTDLIVETDGFTYHSTRTAFERDRERDQALTLAGFRVVRFTDRQLTREPERAANRLRLLIAHSGSRASS